MTGMKRVAGGLALAWAMAASAQSATFTSTDVPKAIPELSAVDSVVAVSGLTGNIADVNVQLNITHPLNADLDVYLVGPTGVTVELFTDVGGVGHDFTGTILDDQAATAITDGTAPFAGSFRPEGLLSAFNGLNPNGTWTLRLQDDAQVIDGTLDAWSLTIETGEPCPPPPMPTDPVPADGATNVDVKTDWSWSTAPAGPTDVGIFQDVAPWGSIRNQQVLIENGIAFTILPSSGMGAANLSSYQKVVMASAQPNTFYTQLAAQRARLEAYVAAGGVLDLHLASQVGSGAYGATMPGGFVVLPMMSNAVSIADAAHPLLNTPNTIPDTALDNWDNSTHAVISTLPPGAHVIARETGSGQPCAAVLSLGQGHILVTTQTVEWTQASLAYLENTLLYMGENPNCPVTYDVYLGTANPPTAKICSGLAASPCDPPADLERGTTYYWQVVARGPSNVTPGPVWSFTTGGVCPLPAAPAAPAPADGSTQVGLQQALSWGVAPADSAQAGEPDPEPPPGPEGPWWQAHAEENWCAAVEQYLARAMAQGQSSEATLCGTQGVCDNPATRDQFIPGGGTPTRTFRVALHVFCADNGTNCTATQASVDAQMATLNAGYQQWGVQFEYETEFINSSQFRDWSPSEESAMKSAYADTPTEKLNIYVVYNSSAYAVATFPWDPAALTYMGGIVMHQPLFGAGQGVLAHEIGHCLGLWHTHHGVTEVAGCDGCHELAGGANGDVTGDFCSQTMPTPLNRNCASPSGTDACNGVPWGTTDFHNFMGYAPPTCLTEFKPQQAGRFHCWSESVLAGWLTEGGLTCPTTYDVYLDTANPPVERVCSDASTRTCDPGPLAPETTYFWKVVAKNEAGNTEGPVWSFTTWTCEAPHAPADPLPADGAVDVPVDAELRWNVPPEPPPPPVKITFSEVALGTNVNGMTIGTAKFSFAAATPATVTSTGPGTTKYILPPNIEGPSTGTLTVEFTTPVYGVGYGLVLALAPTAGATTMVLYDEAMNPLGTFAADTTLQGFPYPECWNVGTSQAPIAKAVVTFQGTTRFALDNLTYTLAPGGVPALAAAPTHGPYVAPTWPVEWGQAAPPDADPWPAGRYEYDRPTGAPIHRIMPAEYPAAATGCLIVNGDFEAGSLAGWTAVATGGGGFVLNNGAFDPPSPDPAMPPCAGAYGAISTQTGGGVRTLYQDVALPPAAGPATLKWTDQIRNHAAAFVDPTQEFRVEIRNPATDAVLATVFSTKPGDPLKQPCTQRTADLTPYAGQSVRIAFVEEDHNGYFNVHLDDVCIEAGQECPVIYDVYLDTVHPPAAKVCSDLGEPPCNPPGDLAACTTYYWRVVARYANGAVEGPVWSFKTTGPCQQAVLSCAPEAVTAAAGGTIPLLLFVEQVPELRSYQATIAITRLSGAGSMSVATCAVETNREDYVFQGKDSSPATDCANARLASALASDDCAGASVKKYLGTFNLFVSEDATEGSEFQVSILPGPATFLKNCQRPSKPVPFTIAPTCLLVVRPPVPIPFDFDADADVDLDDWEVFHDCAAGPAVPHAGTGMCVDSDADGDGDVDQEDFAGFQRCYSGREVGNAGCLK